MTKTTRGGHLSIYTYCCICFGWIQVVHAKTFRLLTLCSTAAPAERLILGGWVLRGGSGGSGGCGRLRDGSSSVGSGGDRLGGRCC